MKTRIVLPLGLVLFLTLLTLIIKQPAWRDLLRCSNWRTGHSPDDLHAATGQEPRPAETHARTHDVNRVRLRVNNTGQIGNDLSSGNAAGFWPAGTTNNYVFGGGIWIGGIADLDGDEVPDTVVLYGYDPLSGGSEHGEGRVGQDPDDPLTRVMSSTVAADLLEWPDEFRDGSGAPVVHSLQDFVTIYNDISGDPVFEAGRCGIEVRQRSMAFTGGLASNAILFLFELVNRSDSMPDGPYTLEEAFISFIFDMDIGPFFGDDMASVLDSVEVYGKGMVPLNTAVTWDSNFEESEPWEGKVGFVGATFFQPPGDAWDGLDNDGDGMVDESPFDGVDDDGDGVPDDIPDEVDEVSEFHFTLTSNPYYGLPPYDPRSDREAYRMMRCLTEFDCAERDSAADIRFVWSCGPFDLPPGESQIAGLALVFADPVGDPDSLVLTGDPPRPDPADSVLSDLIATILEVRSLYESGFESSPDYFDVFGTTELEDTNDPHGPCTIYTVIVDSIPLARCTLHYSTDCGPYEEVVLDHFGFDLYWGEIPGQPLGSAVSYYVQAVDSAFQMERDPDDAPVTRFEFEVLDVPDFLASHCEGCPNSQFTAPADYDRDGFLDLFLVTPDGPSLYRNMGDGSFEDVAGEAGLDVPITARSASWGDYDNDGFPDLFVATWSPDFPHLLFRNSGDGTFEDVTEAAGVRDSMITSGGSWGDVNGNGLLDLVTAQMGRDRLYRNNGDGTFTDRAQAWGLEEGKNDWAVTLFDKDGDRDPDLLLTGSTENILYENSGGGFIDVTSSSGIAGGSWGSVEVGDFDGDGDADLLFSGDDLALFMNLDGSGTYLDVTVEHGISGSAVDASWADVNADGRLDIVTTKPAVLVQYRDGIFHDLTAVSGVTGGTGNRKFILPCDLDNDGRLDIVFNQFWYNDGFSGVFLRHRLDLSLRGTVSSTFPAGARARLFSGDLGSTRWVDGNGGKAQSSPTLTFGLDTLSVADSLVIDWPSGITQRIRNLCVDRILLVEEDSTLVPVEGGADGSTLPRAHALHQNYPNPFNPQTTITFDVPGEENGKRRVSLEIYNVRGKHVRTLFDGKLEPGRHSFQWDGKNGGGDPVSSGVYLYVMKSGSFESTKKMVLLK